LEDACGEGALVELSAPWSWCRRVEADREEREGEDFRISDISVMGSEFPSILRQCLAILVNDGRRPH